MDLRGVVDIHVYAGSIPAEPAQGALIVTRENAVTGGDLPGAGMFLTPKKVGPISLTSIYGETVAFDYAGGTGTFNLTTDKYTM